MPGIGRRMIPAGSDSAERAGEVRLIRAALDSRVNQERREKAQSYFPTAMEVLGVAVKDIRNVLRPITRKYKKEEPGEVLALARLLIAANVHEMRQLAYELIEAHKGAFGLLNGELLEELGTGMDNWATVDCFCVALSGRAWQQALIGDKAIESWARSENRWWRRAALVSTVPLNLKSRGGCGDPERTFRICGMLAGDHDDMVVKALSWALREYAKRDGKAVRSFINEHDRLLHRRVVAEVQRKLTTGRKNG